VSADGFVLDKAYLGCKAAAKIRSDCKSNQSVPLRASISDIVCFRKYVSFEVEQTPVESHRSGNQINAFAVMMDATKRQVWPKLRSTDRPSARAELHNTTVTWLQDLNLGWMQSTLPLGENFVQVLDDALWYIDPHLTKLALQQCNVPMVLSKLQGFNVPGKHKHVPKPVDADRLRTLAHQLFNILEQVSTWLLLKMLASFFFSVLKCFTSMSGSFKNENLNSIASFVFTIFVFFKV